MAACDRSRSDRTDRHHPLPLLACTQHRRQDLAGTTQRVGAGLAAPRGAQGSAGAAFGGLGWHCPGPFAGADEVVVGVLGLDLAVS
jgi:hypothetical protein